MARRNVTATCPCLPPIHLWPELYEHRWTHTNLIDPAGAAVIELYAPLILEGHAHEITFTPN